MQEPEHELPGREASRPAARHERPSQMMTMTLQQQTALTRRARGKEPGDRLIPGTKHAMSSIHRQAALVVHEYGSHGPHRDEWRLSQ